MTLLSVSAQRVICVFSLCYTLLIFFLSLCCLVRILSLLVLRLGLRSDLLLISAGHGRFDEGRLTSTVWISGKSEKHFLMLKRSQSLEDF